MNVGHTQQTKTHAQHPKKHVWFAPPKTGDGSVAEITYHGRCDAPEHSHQAQYDSDFELGIRKPFEKQGHGSRLKSPEKMRAENPQPKGHHFGVADFNCIAQELPLSQTLIYSGYPVISFISS